MPAVPTPPPPSREHVDTGLCLSLHQPWAQLLVLGIKRIEGRGWPSSHRGRLWIHATAQHPSVKTVRELKDFFQEVHGEHEISFPEQLPVSALVGCVTVVDVLTAEQVAGWGQLPDALKLEVGSPHAFLCQDPMVLARPISMRGSPKMWQLPPQLLARARAALQPPPQIGPAPFSWSAWPQPEDLRTRRWPPNPRKHLFRNKYQQQYQQHFQQHFPQPPQPPQVSPGKRLRSSANADEDVASPEKARRLNEGSGKLLLDHAKVASSWQAS